MLEREIKYIYNEIEIYIEKNRELFIDRDSEREI